jgi:anti-anti-sigma regulatory factor
MNKKSASSIKVVTWDSRVNVNRAGQLKTELLEAFAASNQVAVSLSLVVSIDGAGIQLLFAARAMAERDGKQFRLTGTLNPEVARAFFEGGFIRVPCTDAIELEEELFRPFANGGKTA